jgi:hypothetical protein
MAETVIANVEDGDFDDAAEREMRRGYIKPDFRVFQGGIPPAVFFIANWLGPTQVAIALSFAASVWVFVRNPGSGVIRALSVLGFCVVTGSAIVGLALDSDKAFVAQNLIGDFAITAVCIGSVLIGRPLIGAIARELVPGIQPVMPVDHRVFVRLTLINAALNLGTGLVRILMLGALSANAYVVVSRVAFLPISALFFVLCYRWITQEAIRIWPADMPPPDEWRSRARQAPSPTPGVAASQEGDNT